MEMQNQPQSPVKRPVKPQIRATGPRQGLAQAPTARIVKRNFLLRTDVLLVVSVVCLAGSGYFGLKVYNRMHGKEGVEKIEVKVDKTKEYYTPKLKHVLRGCDEALYVVNMNKELLATTQGNLPEEDAKKVKSDLLNAKGKINDVIRQLGELDEEFSKEFNADSLKGNEELEFSGKVKNLIGNAEQGGLYKEIITINNLIQELK